MSSGLLRIVCLITLIVSLLTLTNLAGTAAALIHADPAPCCDLDRPSGAGEKEGTPLSCPLPDCPCTSCMSVDLVRLSLIERTAHGTVAHYTLPQHLHSSAHISSIDYPPESA